MKKIVSLMGPFDFFGHGVGSAKQYEVWFQDSIESCLSRNGKPDMPWWQVPNLEGVSIYALCVVAFSREQENILYELSLIYEFLRAIVDKYVQTLKK